MIAFLLVAEAQLHGTNNGLKFYLRIPKWQSYLISGIQRYTDRGISSCITKWREVPEAFFTSPGCLVSLGISFWLPKMSRILDRMERETFLFKSRSRWGGCVNDLEDWVQAVRCPNINILLPESIFTHFAMNWSAFPLSWPGGSLGSPRRSL